MIEVIVRSFFSVGRPEKLREFLNPEGGLTVGVPEGTTVEGLILWLELLGPGVSPDDLHVFVFVNGAAGTLDDGLRPGDVVDLHLPAMGG